MLSIMDKLDLAILAELEHEFSPQVLRDLIKLTVESAERELVALAGAIETGSNAELRRIAHRMVGIFGQYGASKASSAARNVQAADESMVVPACSRLLQAGRTALVQLRQYALQLPFSPHPLTIKGTG